jgi:hypothetical protein
MFVVNDWTAIRLAGLQGDQIWKRVTKLDQIFSSQYFSIQINANLVSLQQLKDLANFWLKKQLIGNLANKSPLTAYEL